MQTSPAENRQVRGNPSDFYRSIIYPVLNVNENAALQVVDENGEPKVVYHGTWDKFNEFSREKLGGFLEIETTPARSFVGFWFSENPMSGFDDYMECFINLRSPKEYESLGGLDYDLESSGEDNISNRRNIGHEYRNTSIHAGNDGVIINYDLETRGYSFVAFFPEQIKSATENAGTYAPENPDIRYSIRRASRSSPMEEAAMALSQKDDVARYDCYFGRNGRLYLFDTSGGRADKYVCLFSVADSHSVKIISDAVEKFRNGALEDSEWLYQLVSSLRDERTSGDAPRGDSWRRAFVDNLGRNHELSRENGEISDGISDDEGNRGDGEGLGRDGVRYLKDSSGAVCGYYDPVRNELHLNKDFSDFDTPIHEWTHVWMGWVKRMDARV